MSKFLYIFADNLNELNCSKHNCLFPAEAINRVYPGVHEAKCIHISQFDENSEEVTKLCMDADLIIIERNLFDMSLVYMMLYRIRGKKIALIWDDAYHIMHYANVSFPFWNEGLINYRDQDGKDKTGNLPVNPVVQLGWGLKLANGAIFPSKVLADDWSEFTDTYVTHNYLNVDRYIGVQPLNPHKEIFLGWHGSLSHFSSFTDSGVLQALTKVARKYDNVKVLIGGDKRVFDRINLPDGKKIFQSFVPEEVWPAAMKNIDIGIAPLASPYDARRSWIKVLEFMVAKTPWIASDYPTYDELGEYGILVHNTPEQWEDAMSKVIENIDEYRNFANGKPYEFAVTQSWDGNIHKVVEIFEKIMNKPEKKIDIGKLKYMDLHKSQS